MSKLQLPVRRHLVDPLDEEAVFRIHQKIAARGARPGKRSALIRVLRPGRALALAAAAVVLLWFFGSGFFRSGSEAGIEGRDAGALADLDGNAVVAPTRSDEPQLVALSDGSSIALDPGASFEILENSGTAFSVLLQEGRAEFAVTPGGPRRWTVECGAGTVSVVGTQFVVDRRADETVAVSVSKGIVLVRGEGVSEGVQRLTAGDSVTIGRVVATNIGDRDAVERDAAELAPANPDDAAPKAATSTRPVDGAIPSGAAREPSAGSWKKLAESGEFQTAYEQLGATGIQAASANADPRSLWTLVDVARRSGHATDAVSPLKRLAAGGDGLAAFTLAKLKIDAMGQPAEAGRWFATAIQLGVPGGLMEVAQARLVEARIRAGDRAGAEAAATSYRGAYPTGQYVAAIDKWLAP